MRLVDIDKVLEFVEIIKCDNNIPKNYGTILDIMRFIRRQPTSYDVEKVIEKLKKASYNHTYYGEDFAIDTETAIEIVEGGGIYE